MSLKGSPTVSPVTAALCASEPLYVISPLISTPASKDFFALSHAPPALFWKIAQSTPDTVTPAMYPPSISAMARLSMPKAKGTKAMTSGNPIVSKPGNIISFNEASVEIATHLSYSGFPVPSIIPGIALNCLLTSCTISIAAFPTAFIAKAENTTGTIPPTNSMAKTGALKILIPSIPVNVT